MMLVPRDKGELLIKEHTGEEVESGGSMAKDPGGSS